MIQLPKNGILYHGSYLEISNIDLTYCRYGLDFGNCFYLTSSYQQAKSNVSAFVRKAR